jgi:hypothetical protein
MIINSSLYSSGMTNLNSAIPVAQPKSLIISNSGFDYLLYTFHNHSLTNLLTNQAHIH